MLFLCLFITLILLTPISLADDDFDTLQNGDEIKMGTNPEDADTDNDGIRDGDEIDWDVDSDGDGEWQDNLWYEDHFYNDGINALDSDSDNDGVPDGTESGVIEGHSHTYKNSISDDPRDQMYEYPILFEEGEAPDKDGNTTTDPFLNDTDGDGLFDGWDDLNNNSIYDPGEEVGEDINANGRVDAGETDPNIADTDGGGVEDGAEIAKGTDPLDPEDDFLVQDSDGDGYPDDIDTFPNQPNEWEDTDDDGIGDNADTDDDDDGYLDEWEDSLGTDPKDATSIPPDYDGDGAPDGDATNSMPWMDNDDDDDGMADWWEENYGLDPKDPSDANEDTDGDGLTNLEEYREDTDPLDPNDGGGTPIEPNDTDGDGLPDEWEMKYFDDLSQNGNGDYDNDNYTNKEEYDAGSIPTNSASMPLGTDKEASDEIPIFIWIAIIIVFIIIIVIILILRFMKKKPSSDQFASPPQQLSQPPPQYPQSQQSQYPDYTNQPQVQVPPQTPGAYPQAQAAYYQPPQQPQTTLEDQKSCPICYGERQYILSQQKWFCPRCQQ